MAHGWRHYSIDVRGSALLPMIPFDLRAYEFVHVHFGTCTFGFGMLQSYSITYVMAFQSVGKHSSVVCSLLSMIAAEQWTTSKGLQRTIIKQQPATLLDLHFPRTFFFRIHISKEVENH